MKTFKCSLGCPQTVSATYDICASSFGVAGKRAIVKFMSLRKRMGIKKAALIVEKIA